MPARSASRAASPKNPETGSDPGTSGRVTLGFGNLYASVGDHMGHFYQTEEEWKNILVRFLKAGLEAGDKCVHVIEPGSGRQGILEALAADGIDVASATDSRQLVLEEGRSHPPELQEMLRATLGEIPEKFPLLRWGGEMTAS